jgi:hypothetical protein
MKINYRVITIAALSSALLNQQMLAEPIISVGSPDGQYFGCIAIWTGQGYRVGWTQADTFAAVSVSAKVGANGAANQTGRAYLTTQIGPGTIVANEIASTNFIFPVEAANLVLFSGLILPPGSYYLSIIGDSTNRACCWAGGGTTNVITGTTVTCLGGFGAAGGVVSNYFPASPVYVDSPIPPMLTVGGTDMNHPALQISQSGNSVLISWTTNSIGFGLECADALTSTNWQSISQPIFRISDIYAFPTNAGGTLFYRLKKQTN